MHSGKELRCQTNNINADTTGLGKGPNTLGKALPSAALGKDHSAKKQPAKGSLPSAFCWALGKAFAGALGKEKHLANKRILEK